MARPVVRPNFKSKVIHISCDIFSISQDLRTFLSNPAWECSVIISDNPLIASALTWSPNGLPGVRVPCLWPGDPVAHGGHHLHVVVHTVRPCSTANRQPWLSHSDTMSRGRRHTRLPQSLPSARAELSSPGTMETETWFSPKLGAENLKNKTDLTPLLLPRTTRGQDGGET